MTNQTDVMNTLNCAVSGMNITGIGSSALNVTSTTSYYDGNGGSGTSGNTLWGYWQNQYYPYVIRESYPVYIQDKAMDKGKQAFELLKALMDKNLVKVDKVKDFIEAMDTILKTL